MTLPPVYALYCEELPDRRHKTEAHLLEYGIRPTWWRSFHGPTWGLRATLEHSPGYCVSPGHVGLLLGHYSLWQHLYVVGIEEALIVEDDVLLCDDFAGRLAAVRDALPATWQFVFLGLAETTERILPKITHAFPGGMVRLSDPFGTHCYLVRRSALPELLWRMAEARTHVDIQLARNVLGRLDWYACEPGLADQRTRTGEWTPSCG